MSEPQTCAVSWCRHAAHGDAKCTARNWKMAGMHWCACYGEAAQAAYEERVRERVS
jgi:hypothetical protein